MNGFESLYGITVKRSAISSVMLYDNSYAVIAADIPQRCEFKVPIEFVTKNDMHGKTDAVDWFGYNVEFEVEP